MVTDPKEIEIISEARQKNVADPNRSRDHFHHIFEDFFHEANLDGQSALDLGPGHWDFGELMRKRGGRLGIGIDNDPAVLALGRYKGFSALEGNLKTPEETNLPEIVDGLFCKFAMNAFWHWNDEAAARGLVRTYLSFLNDTGWIWVSPWNGVPAKADLSPADIERALGWQREEFLAAGCQEYEFSDADTRYYGVHGNVASNSVFLRGLSWTKA